MGGRRGKERERTQGLKFAKEKACWGQQGNSFSDPQRISKLAKRRGVNSEGGTGGGGGDFMCESCATALGRGGTASEDFLSSGIRLPPHYASSICKFREGTVGGALITGAILLLMVHSEGEDLGLRT